jgi:hypothetical protein
MTTILIPCWHRLACCLTAACIATGIAASAAQGAIEPAARELMKSVSSKLGSAQTIRLTAKHKLDPTLSVGTKLDHGPLKYTVRRPNQCYVLQSAGDETRELMFDGRTLCLMQPALKIHAITPVKAGSIDQLADAMDERFGFRPPVAELLSADAAKQIFLNVTSAKVTGTEWIGFTRCERLHFEQQGMTGDLWVGQKDKLPRRYLLTFPGLSGHPTWDIRLSKWELNGPVDASLFSKRPAADSQKVQLLKSR